jgi:hypothetical protein
MKKINPKKLNFNTLSVSELNFFQLIQIKAGSDSASGVDVPTYTLTIIQTQTNPKDGYSMNCIGEITTDKTTI